MDKEGRKERKAGKQDRLAETKGQRDTVGG